jgi:hypothetical protein
LLTADDGAECRCWMLMREKEITVLQ